MTNKRYRIEHSLGLPDFAGAAPAASPRGDEVLDAIHDLRRFMEASAGATVDAFRRELGEALAMRGELDLMKEAIVQTKADLAALHRSETSGKGMRRASDELDAVVDSTERATTDLLGAIEEIETRAGMLRATKLPAAAGEHVEAILERVVTAYEACNFQDLTGQRIGKIVGVMKFIEEHLDRLIAAWASLDSFRELMAAPLPPAAADDERALLNGPKLDDDPGHVEQSDIDALFD